MFSEYATIHCLKFTHQFYFQFQLSSCCGSEETVSSSFFQVSEQDMDHIIARSTHKDKMSKTRGLITLHTFTFNLPNISFNIFNLSMSQYEHYRSTKY